MPARPIFRRRAAIVLLALAFLPWRPALADRVAVFAAAGLRHALDAADAAYQRQNADATIAVSYGASGALARQIENGAAPDLFISADPAWMDYLARRRRIEPDSRQNLVGDALVLVAPAAGAPPVAPVPPVDPAALLAGGRLAIADPLSVPAGRYAEAALRRLGAWPGVQARLARAPTMRAALDLVGRGAASYAIVYATEAAADRGVEVVAAFPADSHPPILYPIAVVAGHADPPIIDYLSWLASPAAAGYFVSRGFTIPQ